MGRGYAREGVTRSRPCLVPGAWCLVIHPHQPRAPVAHLAQERPHRGDHLVAGGGRLPLPPPPGPAPRARPPRRDAPGAPGRRGRRAPDAPPPPPRPPRPTRSRPATASAPAPPTRL